MRVLMFGWEFPPHFAGGVGMVCYELTKELASNNVSIDYVMPFSTKDLDAKFLRFKGAQDEEPDMKILHSKYAHLSKHEVRSLMSAYQTSEEYEEVKKLLDKCSRSKAPSQFGQNPSHEEKVPVEGNVQLYGERLLDEMDLFSKRVEKMHDDGSFDNFDIIHAHDWTTLPAAKAIKEKSGKPFIAHVHITEVNKAAGTGGVNPEIFAVEKEGFNSADKVVAISNSIKQTLIQNYGVDDERIEVIHNGGVQMSDSTTISDDLSFLKEDGRQIVSLIGRVTGMKGPENFVRMAQKVLEHKPNTRFVVAGTGDKLAASIALAQQLGIKDDFYFHGFYNRKEAEDFFAMSDVFVLPSLMEPFGVTPLEAMQKKTPVIISKQSGVSEILNHCFKVDFWDINKMSSQVISLLTYPELSKAMVTQGLAEAKAKDWKKPAAECMDMYTKLDFEKKNPTFNTHKGVGTK